MRFFKSAVAVALAAFSAVAFAQPSTKANAITAPTLGTVIDAGEPFEIKWMNVVGQQVTLVIMDGNGSALQPIRTIATNIPNTGSYTWNTPEDLPRSGTYTIRISYDQNPSNFNYSDRFIFQSDVVASSSSRASTTSAPTTSTSSAASTTSEASSSSTETETETTTTSAGTSTTVRTTSTRRSTTSESTSQPTDGAPPSAGTTTLSSPLAVIMAVLAATLFIH